MLRWARQRGGLSIAAIARRFPRFEAWESGTERPTLKQLERFAKITRTPIGLLFLPEPPAEPIPIPDLRTVGNVHLGRPSPDLLDTVFTCQQRQEWYRDFAHSMGEASLDFVKSVSLADDVAVVAAEMRQALGLDLAERRSLPTWTDALRRFIEQAEALGILVMCSGVVGNNNRRRLDPDEFRGFAICDDLAPLVFINGADTKAAQMFTLAHELAHIWLGQSALSDAGAALIPNDAVELWCNKVAAEILVPLDAFREACAQVARLDLGLSDLARRFKVSTLVILRRMYDSGRLAPDEFRRAYDQELKRLCAFPREAGGDFYLTHAARVSKRFARALVIATLEGRTLYRDAFRLLGISKLRTFQELGRNLGITA
jgi:Zn-dependent peptidase ImmA (M78 family)/transcriptional regulator with XRE-family HTH domain